MKTLILILFALLGLSIQTGMCDSPEFPEVELLVVEQDGCAYCERFRREIAVAYPKTEEGRRAPLRWLDLHQDWPPPYDQLAATSVTPTFILVANGKEVDRLYGYTGDEYFWFLLQQMLDKLDTAN